MDMKYFRLEDIFFTGIIAGEILNFNFYGDKGFCYQNLNFWIKFPCLMSEFIAVHSATSDIIEKNWKSHDNKCSIFSTFFSLLLKYFQ
jgi:hypothetical protein